MKDNRIKYYKIVGCSFLVMILIFSLLQWAYPDKKYSAAEKRNLELQPEITWSSVKQKEYSADFENYLTDQVPGRDTWVYLNTMWNRLMGQNLSNGVYNGKSGYLIQQFKPADSKISLDNTTALKDFLVSRPDSRSYVMFVPTASEIAKDYLPMGAAGASQKEWYKENTAIFEGTNIKPVNVFSALADAAKSKQLYYKTDHHWTTDGAYTAFGVLAKAMDLSTDDIKWKRKVVCDDFQGTLMSKSGFYSSVKDDISIYTPNDLDQPYIVSYEEEQKKTASVYSESGLKSDDPYQVFLGGNFPLIKIQTNIKSDRKLLILKDSYANSMVPFLLPYFSEIDMIDARYYAGDIKQEMDASGYTDILALYNIETYSEDQTMKTLLLN